jgi:hypothetical protein
VSEQVVIAERFRGPPSSGHGGYSAAMAAQFVDGPAEVTLRRPPPLETPLEVRRGEGGDVELIHQGQVVAQARPVTLELEVPEPVGVQEAEAAAARSPLLDEHPFSSCFVCGTDREPGDGMRLFAGPVEGRQLFAAPWTPDVSLAGADGAVLPEFVWSVLDCPGGNVIVLLGDDVGISVLARFAAKQLRPVRADQPHVAIGWPIGRERRKLETGSAILTADGAVCALARAIWVELSEEQIAAVGTTGA